LITATATKKLLWENNDELIQITLSAAQKGTFPAPEHAQCHVPPLTARR